MIILLVNDQKCFYQLLIVIICQNEVIDLLATSMEKMPDAPGFLIDGFPANMKQAEIFVDKVRAPHKIIFLEVPEAVMTPRLKDGVNFNDQDDTIKKRIFTYLKDTQPSIKHIIEKWSTTSKTVSFTFLYSWILIFYKSVCYFLLRNLEHHSTELTGKESFRKSQSQS